MPLLAARVERAVTKMDAVAATEECVHPIYETLTGRCIRCGGQAAPSAFDRITVLEESNKTLTEQLLALNERIAKLEAAARRTLL